ncbi:MAG: hypothetical protein AB7K64_14140 [Variibacter sp.]
MIFRAVAVTAVLVIASIGPAASSTCDQRIANLCPGAPISETAAGAPVAATSTAAAAPLKITSAKRAQRSAKRHSRSKRYARHRRGKSTRITSARKRSHVASRRERKRHERHAKTDEMVGLASQAPDEGDKPLGDGPALGGGVPAEAVAGPVRASDAPTNSPTPRGALSAFASIGANTLPSRAFQPVASNTPSTVVTARTVNSPTMTPVRVASADVAPIPAAAPKPQKPAPQQVMQASTIGGIEITSLRAMFLVFGALLLAGTAVRLAIG